MLLSFLSLRFLWRECWRKGACWPSTTAYLLPNTCTTYDLTKSSTGMSASFSAWMMFPSEQKERNSNLMSGLKISSWSFYLHWEALTQESKNYLQCAGHQNNLMPRQRAVSMQKPQDLSGAPEHTREGCCRHLKGALRSPHSYAHITTYATCHTNTGRVKQKTGSLVIKSPLCSFMFCLFIIS